MNPSDLKFTENNTILPLCPHCAQSLPEIYVQNKGQGILRTRKTVYFCPHCRKVLGIDQEWGGSIFSR